MKCEMAYRGCYPHDADAGYRVSEAGGETLSFCRLRLDDCVADMHQAMAVGGGVVIHRIAGGPQVRY